MSLTLRGLKQEDCHEFKTMFPKLWAIQQDPVSKGHTNTHKRKTKVDALRTISNNIVIII